MTHSYAINPNLQVCRALVPVVVMGISMIYYRKSFSASRKFAVIPIVIGVAMSFYGDMTYTSLGAFYTLFCVLLAALKAVVGESLSNYQINRNAS